MAREPGSTEGSRAPSSAESWRVALLTRDVPLDEAEDNAFDVPRMVFRGSVQPAARPERVNGRAPDLVILDCTGADEHGMGLLVGAHRRWPDARVLLLAAPDDAEWLARAVHLGVRGALPTGYDPSQVSQAAERIRLGELWFSRRLTQQILSIQVHQHHSLLLEHLAESPGLTERERDVARHAVQGLSNAEIANELGLHVAAVQELIRHAYRKLRAQHRSELILGLAMGHRVDTA